MTHLLKPRRTVQTISIDEAHQQISKSEAATTTATEPAVEDKPKPPSMMRKLPLTPFACFAKDKHRRKEITKKVGDDINVSSLRFQKELRNAWKNLSSEERKPYIDASNADRRALNVHEIGKSVGLPGWQMQVLPNNKVAYVHISGAVTMTKPKNLRRITAAAERGLSDYCKFVKENFDRCGSIAKVAEEWRHLQNQEPSGNASKAAESLNK
jgi:hypothetical protein